MFLNIMEQTSITKEKRFFLPLTYFLVTNKGLPLIPGFQRGIAESTGTSLKSPKECSTSARTEGMDITKVRKTKR